MSGDFWKHHKEFSETLKQKGYDCARKLEDGSWTGLLPADSAWELHTGIDAFGPRKRFIYAEHSGASLWFGRLEFMDDEPEDWVRKVPVPRYFTILHRPDGSKHLGVYLNKGVTTGEEAVKWSIKAGESLEVFLDDCSGKGAKRFVACADQLRLAAAPCYSKRRNETMESATNAATGDSEKTARIGG